MRDSRTVATRDPNLPGEGPKPGRTALRTPPGEGQTAGDSPLLDEPRNHPFLWLVALFLLFLSVPFYYPEGRTPSIVYGLPDWCWITLAADLCFAALTSYLVLVTWKPAPPDEGTDEG